MKAEEPPVPDIDSSLRTVSATEPDRSSTDQPAIGILTAPGIDADAIAGSILRAREHGHDPFVVSTSEPSERVRAYARQLDVPTFWPEAPANGYSPRSIAISVAREVGYPGLVWQPVPDTEIDYERSLDSLVDAEQYAVDAVQVPRVDPEPSVLVAIPTYNEDQTIAEVVRGSLAHADEVLVVDDGSEDATVERAREAGATVVEHEHNRGYGAALQTAFQEAANAQAECLVVVDGDGQHDPEQIPTLVGEYLQSEADLVVGSRTTDGGSTDAPLYRRFGLGVVNVLTNLSLGVVRPRSWISDTQSGFRLYSRRAIESLAEDDDIGCAMSASTDILYHAHHNNFTIEEVGVDIKYDVDDANNIHPISHGIALVMNILRTVEQDRPMTVLGIPGILSVFVGLGFGYWTATIYLANGIFPLGLAVTSIFFGLAGIFAVFTAIILHSLNTHMRH